MYSWRVEVDAMVLNSRNLGNRASGTLGGVTKDGNTSRKSEDMSLL